MFKKILQSKQKKGSEKNGGIFLLRQSHTYLDAFQQPLDTHLDKRLVRTFYNLFIAILILRDRSKGLLLSELGGYICGFSKAPAGTKRISNLLRSKK